jgi:3-oxoacyl-[acyl-carrier-protein] synthase-3
MTTTAPARYSRIIGTGSYLPPERWSNADLAARLARDGIETSDEWIVERTGIRFRHFAAPDVASRALALAASQRALDAAESDPGTRDLIIVAPSTPDAGVPVGGLPAPAQLGIAGCAAFDVRRCAPGSSTLASRFDDQDRRAASKALVVGASFRASRLQGRTTCVLFGATAPALSSSGRNDAGNSRHRAARRRPPRRDPLRSGQRFGRLDPRRSAAQDGWPGVFKLAVGC